MTRRWTIPLAASIAVHGGMVAGLVAWRADTGAPPRIDLRPWEGDGAPTRLVLDGAAESGRAESGYEAPAELLREIGIGTDADAPALAGAGDPAAPDEFEPSAAAMEPDRPVLEPSAVAGASADSPGEETRAPVFADVLRSWAAAAHEAERCATEAADRLRRAHAGLAARSDASAARLSAAARWLDDARRAMARAHDAARRAPMAKGSPSKGAEPGDDGRERARTGGDAGASRGPAAATSNRPPKYPAECRRLRQQGTVVLHVVIEPDGSVSLVRLARSCGHALLDEAAVEAVRSWVFTPASSNGVSVRSDADVPIVFVLRE